MRFCFGVESVDQTSGEEREQFWPIVSVPVLLLTLCRRGEGRRGRVSPELDAGGSEKDTKVVRDSDLRLVLLINKSQQNIGRNSQTLPRLLKLCEKQ